MKTSEHPPVTGYASVPTAGIGPDSSRIESPVGGNNTLKGAVVLFHGILNPNWAMSLMQRRFQRAGYAVLNCSYRSFGQSLDQIAEASILRLSRFQKTLPGQLPLHFVGHSLGAVISRRIATTHEISGLHRIVMLAPPNRGSHVASFFGPYCKKIVPVMDDIADRIDSYVNQIPAALPFETGIIAADPDFVVREESTHLENESDFIKLPGPHGTLIFKESVFQQARHFIEQGRFRRTSDSNALASH